jgi:hypothetical protein
MFDEGYFNDGSNKKTIEFDKKTTEIKDIIGLADKSGVAARKAGELLSEIKKKESYKSKYGSFESYCETAFRITYTTAQAYIQIFLSFTEEEVTLLLVENLKTIADIKNKVLRSQVVRAFASEDDKSYKVKDVIATVALIQSEKKFDYEEIKQTVSNTLKQLTQEKTKRKERSKSVKFGEPIESEAQPEIHTLIEKQPISEMGVVGLFCLLFRDFRAAPFKINGEIHYFKTIKYVQVGFPDACIICRVDDKKATNTELQIEFEYQSFEYIAHKHHHSDKECDMIVCWEDNAKSDTNRSKSEVVKNMPPVFELKSFLKTGKIELLGETGIRPKNNKQYMNL